MRPRPAGTRVIIMRACDTRRHRHRLHGLRRRLRAVLHRMVQEEALADPIGFAEDVGELCDAAAAVQTQEDAVLRRQCILDEIHEVEAALERIQRGTYGRCERCGGPIGQSRMRAVPFTRFCLGCEQELERPGVSERIVEAAG
ncbi:MAG: TraR/DksA C4-type zinc finger protein [Armatimonadetes bacterium]|nr:TraR/DksA C4-type zinc finger protein [Armatimonadota bacterium]